MLSRFLIAFLSRSKNLVIPWLQSRSAVILEPKKRTSVTVSTFYLSICQEVMGLYASYHLSPIKRLFSSFSFSAIRVVSSAYLRLLFLPPILIAAYNSSSLAFLMMCTACRLNKQGDSRQPCRTPFLILNQSVVPYRILTVAF